MRLMVASLLLPFTVDARYRGTFNANQFDLNSLGNPFSPGSFFSLKSLGNEQGRYRSSACVQSAAVAPCSADDPVVCERQGRSRTTIAIPQRDPILVNNPKRREVTKKEEMLCLGDISYTARPLACCSCYSDHPLLLTRRISAGHTATRIYQARSRRSNRG